MIDSSIAKFASALLDALGDAVPEAKRDHLRSVAKTLRPEPRWAGPLTVRAWAKIFRCSRQKMSRMLKAGNVRGKPYTRETWAVDLSDVPVRHWPRFAPSGTDLSNWLQPAHQPIES